MAGAKWWNVASIFLGIRPRCVWGILLLLYVVYLWGDKNSHHRCFKQENLFFRHLCVWKFTPHLLFCLKKIKFVIKLKRYEKTTVVLCRISSRPCGRVLAYCLII